MGKKKSALEEFDEMAKEYLMKEKNDSVPKKESKKENKSKIPTILGNIIGYLLSIGITISLILFFIWLIKILLKAAF